MHVLTVLDHPNPTSFSAAAATRFMEGAQAAGHTVELADLHAEGFNPLWTMQDAEGDETPADVRLEQDRIARADAICLVFPLFWWGMPSMTKGWVDRVWSWGWAYDQLDDPELSLQRPRTGVLLIPAGARSDEIERDGYGQALDTTWTRGTFGYFGWSPRQMELLCGSTGSLDRRRALLDRCQQIGLTLPEPSGGTGPAAG
ncbi:NAD(P)H-dependent oxidoreductase [Tropicibacter sp. Alg240-R139]|uniref:NAD(P)H-dependent oxidoreductase n=1 Tax=Tropicibacter sp. Alg240-R139 TaxID=2305991 RepID=UPI0013E07493|nr:NAD(P)H-dependent oxidoreductase [Tropicibacter sp. Alg240-R139]